MSVIRKKRNTRINRPRVQQVPRKAVPWRALALGGLGLLALAAGGLGLGRLLDQPVTIEVSGGGQRVTDMEVLAAVAQFDGVGFLGVDLDAVRLAAESLPWVDRARVQRTFPAQLRVTITEQVAAARWGERGLLNTRGELFVTAARFALPELPGLHGPAGSEWRVAQRYLEVHRLLTPLGFDVVTLDLGARGAWDMTLSNGLLVRLGRQETEARLARLADVVVPRIQDLQAQVAYIDMRYSNGFVIGWKPGYEPAEQSAGRHEGSSRHGFAQLLKAPSNAHEITAMQATREPI